MTTTTTWVMTCRPLILEMTPEEFELALRRPRTYLYLAERRDVEGVKRELANDKAARRENPGKEKKDG